MDAYCTLCGAYRHFSRRRGFRLVNQRCDAQDGLLVCGGSFSSRPNEARSRRPHNCECDNTHEHAGTCCRPCWRDGFRTVAPAKPATAPTIGGAS